MALAEFRESFTSPLLVTKIPGDMGLPRTRFLYPLTNDNDQLIVMPTSFTPHTMHQANSMLDQIQFNVICDVCYDAQYTQINIRSKVSSQKEMEVAYRRKRICYVYGLLREDQNSPWGIASCSGWYDPETFFTSLEMCEEYKAAQRFIDTFRNIYLHPYPHVIAPTVQRTPQVKLYKP